MLVHRTKQMWASSWTDDRASWAKITTTPVLRQSRLCFEPGLLREMWRCWPEVQAQRLYRPLEFRCNKAWVRPSGYTPDCNFAVHLQLDDLVETRADAESWQVLAGGRTRSAQTPTQVDIDADSCVQPHDTVSSDRSRCRQPRRCSHGSAAYASPTRAKLVAVSANEHSRLGYRRTKKPLVEVEP